MANQGHPIEPMAKAGVASAEQGRVILDGPDGVAITMTADAAEGTARSLLAAAEKAKQQEQDD
jgi:hypothetical protein